MRVISGHQPVYLPWLGLFHKIALADLFVVMDDVQYLAGDWNNRNRVRGPHGPFWLTVPVRGGSSRRTLLDVEIDDRGWPGRDHWQQRHWLSLRSCYGRSAHWPAVAAALEEIYLARPWRSLVELNDVLLRRLLELLGLDPPEWVAASRCGFRARKSALVLEHCARFGADVCVVGAHGRRYIDEDAFARAGVMVHHQGYRHPVYPQRAGASAAGAFVPNLSVVDLLCACGPASLEVLCSGNVDRRALEQLARRPARAVAS